MAPCMREWEEKYRLFDFTPVLSRPSDSWSGEVGWVQEVALRWYGNMA